MGKTVLCVDELRLCDPYMLRTDYFMGLTKRMAAYAEPRNNDLQAEMLMYELIKYLEFGMETRIVSNNVANKIIKEIREKLDENK